MCPWNKRFTSLMKLRVPIKSDESVKLTLENFFSKSHFLFKNIELFSNLSTDGSKTVLQKGSLLRAIGENSAFSTYFLRKILKMIGIQRLAGWIENLPASRYIVKDFWRDFLVPVHTNAESQWLQQMMPLLLHLLCSD